MIIVICDLDTKQAVEYQHIGAGMELDVSVPVFYEVTYYDKE